MLVFGSECPLRQPWPANGFSVERFGEGAALLRRRSMTVPLNSVLASLRGGGLSSSQRRRAADAVAAEAPPFAAR